VLREELAANEASVVIAKAPCVLQFRIRKPVYQIDSGALYRLQACLQPGAALNLYTDADGEAVGDQRRRLRRHVGVSELCKQDAIAATCLG